MEDTGLGFIVQHSLEDGNLDDQYEFSPEMLYEDSDVEWPSTMGEGEEKDITQDKPGKPPAQQQV